MTMNVTANVSSLAPRWLAWTTSDATLTRGAAETVLDRDGTEPALRLGSVRKPIEILKAGPALFQRLVTDHASGPGRTIHLVSRGPAAHAWADELARLDNRHDVRVDLVLDRDPRNGQRGAMAPLAAITALAQRALAVRLILTPRQANRATRHAPLFESLVRDAATRGARDVIIEPIRPWPWRRQDHTARTKLDLLRLRHGLPRNGAGRG